MTFDLEDKIRFEELAPSLQKLFTSSSNYKAQYDKLLAEGKSGQIVKINKNKNGITAEDDFVLLRVFDNPNEANEEMSYERITLYTVINTWMKFWFWYGPALHVCDHTNWERNGAYDPNDPTQSTYLPGYYNEEEFAAKPYPGRPYQRGGTYTNSVFGNTGNVNNSPYILNDQIYAIQNRDTNYDNINTNAAAADTQWGLIQANDVEGIYQANDQQSCAGFINPVHQYSQYKMHMFCYVGWDDDNLMFYVGFMKDSKNIMHSLCFARGAGDINLGWGFPDCRIYWSLIYDMGKKTMCIIKDFTDTIGCQKCGDPETYGAFMYVERNNDKLKGMTTDFNDWKNKKYLFEEKNKDKIPYRKDAIIEWELPNTYNEAKNTIQIQSSLDQRFKDLMGHSNKSAFTQEAYNNIKIMLRKSNHMGFGARSGTPYFSIVAQEGFRESQNGVDLKNNAVWAFLYDKSKNKYVWTYIGTLDDAGVPHKTWLYNDHLQTLYWYDRPGVYIKLTSDNAMAPASFDGQLAKDNNNVITADDNFYKYAAVDNSTDFSNQQFSATDPILNLKNNMVYVLNNTSWQTTGKASDLLKPYIYIYNEILHRLYFYRGIKSDGITLDYDRIKLM